MHPGKQARQPPYGTQEATAAHMHRTWMQQSDFVVHELGHHEPGTGRGGGPVPSPLPELLGKMEGPRGSRRAAPLGSVPATWQAELRDGLRSGKAKLTRARKAWTCDCAAGRSIPARSTSKRPSTWVGTTLSATLAGHWTITPESAGSSAGRLCSVGHHAAPRLPLQRWSQTVADVRRPHRR